MKKALLLLTVFLIVHVHGQDTLVVSGTITDSGSLASVAAAHIVRLTWPVRQLVQSVVTDTSGTFRLVFGPQKHPALAISCTGYRSRTIRLPEDPLLLLQPFVLPPITLLPDQEHLAAVTVRTMKPLIRQEIDRLSYEVPADPDHASLSLLELLRKVPLLSVDGEDNIRLKGNGNYRVFVNGRPSTLFAGNLKEALKAMPAGAVKQIEVITMRQKLTLAMSVNNPYNRYRYVKTRTTAPGFSQQQINQRFYRSFSLNINYHVGQLATEIRKNQRSLSNDDLKTK